MARRNEQQEAAVAHPGSALVTACPGSGKTRVLTRRILRELASPSLGTRRVLAMTYTNRAADEIWSRLDAAGVDTKRLWAGTIHAFCLEWILRPYAGCSERLRRGFRLIDERFQRELVARLRKEHGADRNVDVNTRIGRDGVARNSSDPARSICDAYHAELRSQKAIDFDLILTLGYELVNAAPEIPRVLGATFSLICVDEYQDTQDLQYAILARIVRGAGGRCSLLMVGDPDQAIYASLGGVAKSGHEIREEFGIPEMADLSLSGNYRSTQRVIDYFCGFAEREDPIVSLTAYAKESGTITFRNGTVDAGDIADVVANHVSERLPAGCSESEIAVLAPQWFMVTRIARQLAARLPGVNFDAPGLSPFRGCQDNPWYGLARLTLSSPSPSMHATRTRWAREALASLGALEDVRARCRAVEPRGLLRIVNSIDLSGNDGLAVLEHAFSRVCYAIGLDLRAHPTLSQALTDLLETARSRLADENYSFPNEIDAFRRAFGRGPGVVIGTCHSIKGEEFDTVVAFGLLQGYVPHWGEIFADRAAAAVSARRLLYVVASRAKRHLHLISETGRRTATRRPYEATELLRRVAFAYDAT